MEMQFPPPRRSRFLPIELRQGLEPDWDMREPLYWDGSNFPCKKYSAGPVVASFKAGETVRVKFDGTSILRGGHCQFSISYNAKEFVVINTTLRDCFLNGKDFDITIPKGIPSCEKCTFAWTWISAVGLRKMYMNCADVKITNGSLGTFTGKSMVVANIQEYPWIPEFPSPNDDDRRQLYLDAPSVTVSNPNNSGITAQIDPPVSTPSSTRLSTRTRSRTTTRSSRLTTKRRTVTPTSTLSIPNETLTPQQNDGPCTSGNFRCVSNNRAFQKCSHGEWSVIMSVPGGSRCVQDVNYIHFDFA